MNDSQSRQADAAGISSNFARRLGAILYDSLLLFAILLLATAFALLAMHGHLDHKGVGFRLYIVLVTFGFYGWFWTHGGQTLGMRAWKIRVQRLDGSSIRWWQAVIRFIVAIGSAGAGLLWTLADADRQAIYDHLAKTRVVRSDLHPGSAD